jgi:hypothetical protein
MSHIQKRADRRYRARWLDPDGRERSRTFTRKADAERHLAAVEGAKLSGAYVSDANPVTVGQYARQWAATRPHRQTTATRVESLISKHIEGTTIAVRPRERDLSAQDLRPPHARQRGPDAAGHRHCVVDE